MNHTPFFFSSVYLMLREKELHVIAGHWVKWRRTRWVLRDAQWQVANTKYLVKNHQEKKSLKRTRRGWGGDVKIDVGIIGVLRIGTGGALL
jgi:hypothetical protein